MFARKIREKMGKFHVEHRPLSFEALEQNFGYVLYETTIPSSFVKGQNSKLEIKKIRDLAHVYLNGEFVGGMSREERKTKLNLTVENGNLGILVENLGRINFGSHINDQKGILSKVTLDDAALFFWNMTGYELKDVKTIKKCFEENDDDCINDEGFVFYAQKFKLPKESYENDEKLLDSYLDVSHLTKGLVFINDFNLGRYWSTRGPQYTIYVPGVYLKPYPQENFIVILEEEIVTDNIKVNFTINPIFS